jgi:hypothetical protein
MSLVNGTPLIPLQQEGDWLLVAAGCDLPRHGHGHGLLEFHSIDVGYISDTMSMIRDIMCRLFPSKLVKEQIQDLKQISSLFDTSSPYATYPSSVGFLTSSGAYEDIRARLTSELLKRQEIVQEAREHESWHSVRAYNLCAIVRMAYDSAGYGEHHVYRGRLSMVGEGYYCVCIIAAWGSGTQTQCEGSPKILMSASANGDDFEQ